MTESEFDPRIYWIWLQHALGPGSSKPNRVLSAYPSLAEFYRAGREAWLLEGYFTQKEISKMCRWPASAAAALLEYCGRAGQRVLTPESPEYPELLRQIPNPPCALYVKGRLPDFDLAPPIAIVGTRRATPTGRAAARSIAFELAKHGAAVVSGGALGIDTAAHQGALQANGKTVCVLGCGIDFPYLMANASLRDAVAATGALISEYPPGTQASGSNFPIRNRIISGMALGTLVVEAAGKSGSLITADFALDQGRDVFAVPADIFSPVSKGVNGLIKSGAKPVSSAEEIMEEYPDRFSEKIGLDGRNSDAIIKDNGGRAEEARPADGEAEDLSEDARALLARLTRAPQGLSDLTAGTGLSAARALSAVTELELAGAVRSYSGRRYSLPR
ncbi:MAG TPA: DNA-protecting protein DprA [Ruminococcaceae bacterium]|jgi:DNA processing protein|nr:DNA-protecting protein DprA [Oscillospiraceae bacterium]HBG55682.1 DNA-protecting protein DprA [Oscillospiraceae bacterium]HBQ47082.1 DNA-protecting protein DprA [Oscillospiraceae bacterium]HBT90966.1 DNA-protecting protein DprA [Oscillospiraceae bacterium]HCB91466.1 DNA-protecting protein DprA [Oscillospiraceae bacterium]